MMTSLELVDFINEDRKARAESVGATFPSPGFAKLEHADFLKKVPLVLGQDHAGKFSETVYRVNPSGGSQIPSPGYRFPKREACLMAMSYSYELQAKVFDRMTALEQAGRVPALPNFADPVAAARAWADIKESEQQAVAELALAAPKAAFVDRYVAATSGEKGFREVCKLLQANELEFSEFLVRAKIMYRLAGKMTPPCRTPDRQALQGEDWHRSAQRARLRSSQVHPQGGGVDCGSVGQAQGSAGAG